MNSDQNQFTRIGTFCEKCRQVVCVCAEVIEPTVNRDFMGYIVLERWAKEMIDKYPKMENYWRRGWFRKWYLTKEIAESAIKECEKVYPKNKEIYEYKVVPVFNGEWATIKLGGNNFTLAY